MRVSPASALVLTPQQTARASAEFAVAVGRAGSQRALAGALGVSQQAVSEALGGRVSLGMAALLSVWLDVKVLDVVGER